MNPDNPNFRTPEEEARAAELVRLKAEISSLKARLSMTNSNWPHEKGLHETIARQARVIEKLKEKLEEIRWSWANDAGRQCDNLAFEALAAIEKEGAKDE